MKNNVTNAATNAVLSGYGEKVRKTMKKFDISAVSLPAMSTKEILSAIDTFDTWDDADEMELIGELLRRAGLFVPEHDVCGHVLGDENGDNVSDMIAEYELNCEKLIALALERIPTRPVTLYEVEDSTRGDIFTVLLTYSLDEAIRKARQEWEHLTAWERNMHDIIVSVRVVELFSDSKFTPEEAKEFLRDYHFESLGSYSTIVWNDEQNDELKEESAMENSELVRVVSMLDLVPHWGYPGAWDLLVKLMKLCEVELSSPRCEGDDMRIIVKHNYAWYYTGGPDQLYDVCCEEIGRDVVADIREHNQYHRVEVENIDAETGACSGIDDIIVEKTYTPLQYIDDCASNGVYWGNGEIVFEEVYW